MKLFYNLDTGELLDVNRQLITRWTLRYRDQVALIIAFLRSGDVVDPAGVVIVPAANLLGDFDGDPITPTVTFTKSGSDTTALWTGILTVDSPAIEEELKVNGTVADDVPFFTASIQFYFEADGGKSRSAVTPCDITNSIYRGDELFPVVVAGTGLPALDAHIADTTGAHAASAISFTTAADLTSTNVQAAIAEEAGKRAAIAATTPAWKSTIVTLAGGGATALDGQTGVIDGSTIFTLGRLLFLSITGSGLQAWVLEAGTEATDGESYVRPANYNADTFAYVFKRKL